MLQALSAARSIGSSFKETGQGAIRDRIHGGAQGVCNFLYSQIKDSVKLNSPVSFVNQMENHILIGNDSFTVKTKKVIITAPLPIVKRI